MNDELIAKLAKWKLTGQTSCAQCKFLYFQDRGYSNYTVENTTVLCALNKNPNLPTDLPHDWCTDGGDNWTATVNSRCEHYDQLPKTLAAAHFDVDGEYQLSDTKLDYEAYSAIYEHQKGDPLP